MFFLQWRDLTEDIYIDVRSDLVKGKHRAPCSRHKTDSVWQLLWYLGYQAGSPLCMVDVILPLAIVLSSSPIIQVVQA